MLSRRVKMADLADKTTQQLLRTIVREETRTIVREETADIRQTLDDNMRTIATDVTQIKQTVRKQGVFYEDLEWRFTALAEAVSENLTVQQS